MWFSFFFLFYNLSPRPPMCPLSRLLKGDSVCFGRQFVDLQYSKTNPENGSSHSLTLTSVLLLAGKKKVTLRLKGK